MHIVLFSHLHTSTVNLECVTLFFERLFWLLYSDTKNTIPVHHVYGVLWRSGVISKNKWVPIGDLIKAFKYKSSRTFFHLRESASIVNLIECTSMIQRERIYCQFRFRNNVNNVPFLFTSLFQSGKRIYLQKPILHWTVLHKRDLDKKRIYLTSNEPGMLSL